MPPILHRCVDEVMAKGHDEQSAYAICRTSLGLAADGSEDQKAIDMPEPDIIAAIEAASIAKREDVNPASGVSEYGKVPFADPVNKKYPIDTEEHIRAAWNYIHKAHNAAQYDAGAIASIKNRIASAWRDKIDKAGPPSIAATEPDTLRKTMPICLAVGPIDNGPRKTGNISVDYFKSLVANQKKKPRQIPIYNLVGKPDPEHPEDLDQWPADGWVENFYVDGDTLMADVTIHGEAAQMMRADQIRGASIGTTQGIAYNGEPMGQILAHIVLTNKPLITGMNVAASAGGELVAYHLTAMEAAMAEDKKKADPAPKADGTVNLSEQVNALQLLLTEKDGLIRELTTANANMLEEIKAFKSNPNLELAQQKIEQLEQHNLAEKVRRITARMRLDNQISREALQGWYDHDSDSVVLAGFKGSQFKGSLDLLEYHRGSVPKKPQSRSVASGQPDTDATFTADEKEQIKAAGKDPAVLEATAGAVNFSDWKRRKAAAGKE